MLGTVAGNEVRRKAVWRGPDLTNIWLSDASSAPVEPKGEEISEGPAADSPGMTY